MSDWSKTKRVAPKPETVDRMFADILAQSNLPVPLIGDESKTATFREASIDPMLAALRLLNDGQPHYVPNHRGGNLTSAVHRIEVAGRDLLSVFFSKRSGDGRLSTEVLIDTPSTAKSAASVEMIESADMWVVTRGGIGERPAALVQFHRQLLALTFLHDAAYEADRTEVVQGQPSAIGNLVLHCYEGDFLNALGSRQTAANVVEQRIVATV